jgi:hypothetical protein
MHFYEIKVQANCKAIGTLALFATNVYYLEKDDK